MCRFLSAGCPQGICLYSVHYSGQFEVFAPQGQHVALMVVKFGKQESMLNFTFIGVGMGYRMHKIWECKHTTGLVLCAILTKLSGFVDSCMSNQCLSVGLDLLTVCSVCDSVMVSTLFMVCLIADM